MSGKKGELIMRYLQVFRMIILSTLLLPGCMPSLEDHYQQLRVGMTPTEVKAILGEPQQIFNDVGPPDETSGKPLHFVHVNWVYERDGKKFVLIFSVADENRNGQTLADIGVLTEGNRVIRHGQ
jgi:hypothetical protein